MSGPATTPQPILPGATIGVLGSGQLGRMFAVAARQMGYRVHTLSPDDDTPTGQLADLEISADYDDLAAIERFARAVDVVTFEFENVPAATAAAAARHALVRPSGDVLHVTQNRLREKSFLAEHGFPVTPFAAIRQQSDVAAALQRVAAPGVLKTAGWGYDGKGQCKVERAEEMAGAWQSLGQAEAIWEALVDFEQEVSVVAARGVDGAFAHFGAVANRHERHILDVTVAPADLPPDLQCEAVEIARGVLEQLRVVGVLCVEFFVTRAGKLLINELAPRPHNSGHFTIDACACSQFELQLRAVCGLPLGATTQHRPAAMANLLGDLWQPRTPNWPAALALPGVKLHLYGKAEPRPGRKMGHLTALADTPAAAEQLARQARELLTGG